MALFKNIAALALVLLLAGCDTLGLSKLEYSRALSRAEKGDAKAQAQVAAMAHHACYHHYEDSSWRPACDERACAKWNRLAAESGDVKSQARLGESYLRGECGVKRDPANTIKWLGKAAEQGDVNAAETLAKAYAVGDDIDRDDAQAVKWYTAAAEKGSGYAQMSLAHIYMSGIGVEPDKKQALAWGVKAAQGGDTSHQRQLAKLYLESGDYAEAYYWSSLSWARSAGQGDEIVFTDLDRHLTPDQITAIDARVKADVARQGGK
jgi:TPR repeat protein